MSEYRCTLCPRNCGAVREETAGRGFCRAGTLPKIARVAPHAWEEPCISGTKGSGTILFSGCVLSCVFCQNHEISTGGHGKTVTVEELIAYIRRLEAQGVHNINLVSPTPYTESVIDCLTRYRPSVPVVYNTGGYEKVSTLRRLEGLIDIYLPDLKYVSSELSARYSGAPDYFDAALPAIREMVRQTGKPRFDENGMLLRGTIVRHLVLPQHTKNSMQVLEVLKEEFDDQILVSLMGQYVPMARAADFPEINRRITAREYRKVLAYMEDLELEGFAQELSSATKDFVPDFDLSALELS